MPKTRTARRRPSLATAISLVALVIAMSGSAYAATGGTFILGKANKASSVTSLSNSKGTALSLSSPHGKAPLTVNGVPSTQFLVGHALYGTLAEGGFKDIALPGSSAKLEFTCEQDGLLTFPSAQWTLTSEMNGERAWLLNKGGSFFSALNSGDVISLGSSTSDADSYTTVVQVAWGAGGPGNVATADVSLAVHDSTNTCIFAAQTFSGP